MACLLCKESGNRPDAPWKFTNETFLTRGGGNLLADQWQCEYVYNSNLSLTGVLQECEKARTSVSMFQRGAQGCSRAAFLSMCCVTYGISGVAGLVARVHRKGFAAGLHAVDRPKQKMRVHCGIMPGRIRPRQSRPACAPRFQARHRVLHFFTRTSYRSLRRSLRLQTSFGISMTTVGIGETPAADCSSERCI